MGQGRIITWAGCKAYVGELGKVEGVDGEMWPMGKSLHMLKRALEKNKIKYDEQTCMLSLCGLVKEDPVCFTTPIACPIPQHKEQEAYPVEPECKS